MRGEKRRRGWDWVFTTNLLRPAKAHLQSAATANAHASVWMREQAAVFLQIIFFELAVREDFKKAAVASSYGLISLYPYIFCGRINDINHTIIIAWNDCQVLVIIANKTLFTHITRYRIEDMSR